MRAVNHVAAGVGVLLVASGCIAPTGGELRTGAAAEALLQEESWISTDAYNRAAIQFRFDLGSNPGTCDVRLGMTGSFPNQKSGVFRYTEIGTKIAGWGATSGGRFTVQGGATSTDPAMNSVVKVFEDLWLPDSGYSFLLNITKTLFREYASRGSPLTFTMVGLDVRPQDWSFQGPTSVRAEYSCEGDVRVTVQASREVFLVSQAEFDQAVAAGTPHASVVHEGSSERTFDASMVEIVSVAIPGTKTANGKLDITRPGGSSVWREEDDYPLHVVDGAGNYRFVLNRIGTADPTGPCAPSYCPDRFILSAVGWTPVDRIKGLAAVLAENAP